ncbi:hypothetical protein Tco_0760006 [Tanacetum coccineum]
MTTPITTSTTDSQMHNNIMAAGSRDHPPMLATGRYAQWRSRFLRYIDTRPNVVPATEDSPAVTEQTTVETAMNMTPENRAHFESEKEAIHLILTGIGDEIYSTVDACQTAQEMWEAIERLQQGESLNIQDVKTNLFWEFGQFTSHDGETIESYYTRFYKMMNEMIRNNLTVAMMQVNVQFLQQLQPEWSRFVTIVKQQHKLDEHLLLLLNTSKTLITKHQNLHKYNAPTSKASLPTENPHATTRYKRQRDKLNQSHHHLSQLLKKTVILNKLRRIKTCRKIWLSLQSTSRKLYIPTIKQPQKLPQHRKQECGYYSKVPRMDYQDWISLESEGSECCWARETVGVSSCKQSGIQCFNCKGFGHYAKGNAERQRVQRTPQTDEEIDEQELEAHYSYMAKIQEVPNADSGTDAEPLEQVQYDTDDNVFANDIQHFDQSESISNTCAVETGDSNVTPDSPDMCDNDIQDDQNDVECDDERVALANLKLDVDENKKIQKQLKKANATLTQELTECKSILAETSRTLGKSNIDYDKLERRLNETLGLLAQKETDIKESLKVKAYEISVVKEKHDELVKQSLLTKSHYEGLVKEKTKIVSTHPIIVALDAQRPMTGNLSLQCNFVENTCKPKRCSIQSKTVPSSNGRLNLLHLDLCVQCGLQAYMGRNILVNRRCLLRSLGSLSSSRMEIQEFYRLSHDDPKKSSSPSNFYSH